MALRTAIAKRLYIHRFAATPSLRHQLLTSSEPPSATTVYDRIYNRLHHPRQLNQSPRSSLSGLFSYSPCGLHSGGFSAGDVRKIVRCSQLKNVRSAIKLIPTNSISYNEFVTICIDACGDGDRGLEVAKVLDVAGDVLVLGNVVFLRPDLVAKSMEKVISQSIAIPNDPRKQELEKLERQKRLIDQKAISQVRCELYCGLGFLIIQTLGFMRLTFWELSWDVMEPICFFVTSFHFALAYMFFLRTSQEPTFERYFQRRFRAKQTKLIGVHKFDYERYNELCNVFYSDHRGIMHFRRLERSTRVFN